MTPKEKAEQIYKKMLGDDGSTHPKVFGGVKRCALIAVDEMLYELDHIPFADFDYAEWKMKYWQEVKQEIEKL